MKTFKASLTEATKSQVVVSFGRMNPMTNGHEKLADKIKAEAKKRNADAKLYLSHSTNPKKDPLDFKTKVKFAKKAFGPMVQNSVARTIIEVAKELSGKYDDLIVVVGSDRIPEFKALLNKYNGKDFTFKTIEIVSAGERDPDAEGVSGMSGSKMRGFVTSDDFNSFKQGVPSKLSDSDAKALFDAVKRGMNLKEEIESTIDGTEQFFKLGKEIAQELDMKEAVLSLAGRRQRGMQLRRMKVKLSVARQKSMRRFASPDVLNRRARHMAINFLKQRYSSGKPYADLSPGQKIDIDKRVQKLMPVVGKIASRLLPQVRKAEIQRKAAQKSAIKKEHFNTQVNEKFELFIEAPKLPQDKQIDNKSGTQPSKYYKGLDKDTKDKRDSHFKTQSKTNDADPKSYKDAPGDVEAREKDMPQSKHTKKFKQMFGEAINKQEAERLGQLIRLGLADKKMLTVIQRSVSKIDSGDVLNPVERQATQTLLMTLLDIVTTNNVFATTKGQLSKVPASQMKADYTKYVGEELEYDTDDEESDWEDESSDGLYMAKIELSNLIDDAEQILMMLDDMKEEPEAWVSSKMTLASDYIGTARDYLEFHDYDDSEDDEEDDMTYSEEENYNAVSECIVTMSKEELGDVYEDVSELFEEIEGLKNKSSKSGISYGILKKVYDRGMAAWKGGHRPGTTPQQWAFARVNSFITKGKGTWGGADSDLASRVGGGSSKNEEFSKFAEALEWGTDELRKKYAKDTPGQSEEPCCDDCDEEVVDEACWDTHKQVGLKKKGNKMVPDCVPKNEEVEEEVDWENILVEADYQGKTVKLNDPFRTPDGPKKFGVYTMGPNGSVVVVRFGDPNMEIKRDDPARLKSFRARHGCDNPGPKWKANYWSCQMWRSDKSVSDLD